LEILVSNSSNLKICLEFKEFFLEFLLVGPSPGRKTGEVHSRSGWEKIWSSKELHLPLHSLHGTINYYKNTNISGIKLKN
jgi:hypothetical protein